MHDSNTSGRYENLETFETNINTNNIMNGHENANSIDVFGLHDTKKCKKVY